LTRKVAQRRQSVGGGMGAKMGLQQWRQQIWCRRSGIGGTDNLTINYTSITTAARRGSGQ
jgi:hypothetical protein